MAPRRSPVMAVAFDQIRVLVVRKLSGGER